MLRQKKEIKLIYFGLIHEEQNVTSTNPWPITHGSHKWKNHLGTFRLFLPPENRPTSVVFRQTAIENRYWIHRSTFCTVSVAIISHFTKMENKKKIFRGSIITSFNIKYK
jgi:hypothetical protein